MAASVPSLEPPSICCNASLLRANGQRPTDTADAWIDPALARCEDAEALRDIHGWRSCSPAPCFASTAVASTCLGPSGVSSVEAEGFLTDAN